MEEEEEEEEVEEEEGEPVSSDCPQYQKIPMEDEEEREEMSARRRPRHPPGGRKPPSHWPGRRCPSHASPRPIGREQRGKAEGLVEDGSVTELTGDHDDGCGDDDEGGSSL